ncbi:hypothetical protein AB4212_41815 [Streptomyces sp. 2MCAF27]
MPSVVGLLEQREVAARRRVDELREEADRIQAELAVAEREWNEWAIARSRKGRPRPSPRVNVRLENAPSTPTTPPGAMKESSLSPDPPA